MTHYSRNNFTGALFLETLDKIARNAARPRFDVEMTKVGNSFIVTQDGEPVEHPRRHASWDEARGRAAELRRGK